MRIANANRNEMEELSGVHAGAGAILFGRLWGRSDFESPFAFCHTAILPPHSGIGYHRHDDAEEIFITIDNAAQFTHNGRTAIVEGGAAVPVRSGEIHAIYNHTEQETRWTTTGLVWSWSRRTGCPWGDWIARRSSTASGTAVRARSALG